MALSSHTHTHTTRYVTAGFSADHQGARQTLSRLSRELAALAHVGNSAFAGLVAQRGGVLRRLFLCYEHALKVMKSGASVTKRATKAKLSPTLQVCVRNRCGTAP